MVQIPVTTSKKKDLIVGLIDRSGSMQRIKEDTEGGLLSFIEEQKQDSGDKDVLMALYEFDDEYNEVYPVTPIADVPDYALQPRGFTALVDAIGLTINAVEEAVKKEKPDTVTVLILTDGNENASKEYTLDDVKKRVQQCRDKEWNFIFLGANIDAVSVAQGYGFDSRTAMTYGANTEGVKSTFAAASGVTRSMRAGMVDGGFTDKDRETAMGGESS